MIARIVLVTNVHRASSYEPFCGFYGEQMSPKEKQKFPKPKSIYLFNIQILRQRNSVARCPSVCDKESNCYSINLNRHFIFNGHRAGAIC